MIFFTYTKHADPVGLLGGRVQNMVIIGALWLVHYLLPCKLTLYLRVLVQAAMLSWWYPDTFELNKVLPNLDPSFAAIDQELFGCQPALLFAESMPKWTSEAFCLGYWSYYPMILTVLLYFIFWQSEDFLRASFVLIVSFFAFYVIFDLVPVAGPQFYYEFAGRSSIEQGVFPEVGDYFANMTNSWPCWKMPGDDSGFFYGLVADAHDAGERPTAAFPSSHVGCATVMMCLVLFSKKPKLCLPLLPFYLLLCFATVYIQAHYAIDAIVGFFVGISFYFCFSKIIEN